MFENIKADYYRHHQKISIKSIRVVLETFGLQAVIIYRFGKWSERQVPLIKHLLLLIYFFAAKISEYMYGIHISRSAEIGAGFYIGHFGGILVTKCSIGAGSSIQERVIISENAKGTPKIGPKVWVGGHSKIIGPHTVGEGTTIAAGSHVNSDIPNKCLAAGNPARVIKKDFDNSSIL